MRSIDGTVSVITGAGSGIGRAAALAVTEMVQQHARDREVFMHAQIERMEGRV
jgi:NAD(P)-dependent dehydrogenase (short-subunit alcohol dehydrogenase family)